MNEIVVISSWQDGYRVAVTDIPFNAFEMFDQGTPEWVQTYSCFNNKRAIPSLGQAMNEAHRIARSNKYKNSSVKILWGKRKMLAKR